MSVYKPCVPLRPYVRYYWVLKSRESFCVPTFPIGCPQLIFHRRSPLFVRELDRFQDRFTVSGQVDFPAHLRAGTDTEMIVAVFRPHAIGMFLDTPPSAFRNLEISGYDLGNRRLDELASRVFDCGDAERCVRTVEEWLLRKLCGACSAPDPDRIAPTVKRLMEEPATPVADLAAIACLGKRQFERVFDRCVGMRPKEYARIVRFQKALWLMQRRWGGMAEIAYACGYADQSHFIREFKAFSGRTPGRLLCEHTPYSDLFADPV
ncbi:MAG: AraC family transcriptional regulator [Alistipes sp.]|nr:AraC family transcriptional regulator [Alistipes sp.]